MKARKYILGVALIGLIGSGCTNTWDEHYAQDTKTPARLIIRRFP